MKPLKLISRSEANQQYLAGYLPDYKTTGWSLEPDGKHITFTDGCGIGRLRLVGNKKQQIETFPGKRIKRVRIIRRADGYYCQVRRFGAYEIAPQEQEVESEITS